MTLEPTKKDTEKSRDLASIVVNKTGGRGQNECWRNAQLAIASEILPPSAVYVEGWFVQHRLGVMIEHGWVELGDGTVLDPTLPDDVGTYFPGVRYTASDIFDRLSDTGQPLVWGGVNGFGGFRNNDYKQAYDDALQFSLRLANTHSQDL